MILLKPFTDSSGIDSQTSSMNKPKAIKMSEAQLARFEVIEQEKEILEEEH